MNPSQVAETAQLRLVLPQGWIAAVAQKQVQLHPCGTETLFFQITPPAGLVVRRERIAVDLTVGDLKFGQQAEALITVKKP